MFGLKDLFLSFALLSLQKALILTGSEFNLERILQHKMHTAAHKHICAVWCSSTETYCTDRKAGADWGANMAETLLTLVNMIHQALGGYCATFVY